MRFYAIWRIALAWMMIGLTGCTLLAAGQHGEAVVSATLSPTPLGSAPEPRATVNPPTATSMPTSTTLRPTPPPVGLQVGNTAPDFALLDLNGKTVKLSDQRGQMVMINFWAVWCGFCRIELPEMQTVYEEYQGQGFTVLAVDVREEANLVKEFVEDLGLTFPVLLDRRGETTLVYRIRGLPTSFFVDQDGVIQGMRVGPVDSTIIKQYLAQAGVE